MSSFVLGTAGHIDHGKTALVRALTGVDTDRLKEEQARGITIELGFAELDLGDGLRGGVVDVPGHEAFVRAMVAGASGMDAALLVIAADEGPMPQTLEHLAVLQYMGVSTGIVALTKVDLVDPEWLELVEEEVRDLISSTPLSGAAIVPTSVESGQGIEELRGALADIARRGSVRSPDDLFRMPVDRAFSVRGTGTVVTGTVWSGTISDGARVILQPAGEDARVRRIHAHGREVNAASAGSRAALALAGIPTDIVPRGSDVVSNPLWVATERLTTTIEMMDPSEALYRGRRIRVHLGTAEVMARAFPLGHLDGEAWVELRLEAPVLARSGDRLVIRSYSPVTTIGGGVVLEPYPPRRKASRADPTEVAGLAAPDPVDRATTAASAAGEVGVPVNLLPVVAAVVSADVDEIVRSERLLRIDDRIFARSVREHVEQRLLEEVGAYHASSPLEPGVPVEALRPAERERVRLTESVLGSLTDAGGLERESGRYRLPGYRPSLDARQAERASSLHGRLRGAGLEAPEVTELAGGESVEETQALLEYLVREGRAVRLSSTLVLDRDAVDAFTARVRDELAGQEGLGPADFRAVANVSRRYLVPLLQHLDVQGITVRRGDLRAVVG